MRNLVLTPRFKRAFRKFVQRDRALQSQIEQILEELRTDLSAPNLGTHIPIWGLISWSAIFRVYGLVPVAMIVVSYFLLRKAR
jgi:hypothetical protein